MAASYKAAAEALLSIEIEEMTATDHWNVEVAVIGQGARF